jgi:hypothetical protein
MATPDRSNGAAETPAPRNTIGVDVAMLGALRTHALRIGTLEEWSEVAMEWARAAEAELHKLRVNLANATDPPRPTLPY